MKFIWLGLFVIFCCTEGAPIDTGSSDKYPWLSQYHYINSITDILMQKHNDYSREDPNNEDLKAKKRQEFIASFEALDKNNSRRLYDMTVTNRNSTARSPNLQNDVIHMYEFDYQKSAVFFEKLIKTFENTYDITISYYRETGQYESAKKASQLKQEAVEQMREITKQVLNHLIYKAWETQYPIDSRLFVEKNGHLNNVHQELMKMLSKKYPFRSWLVVVYDRKAKNMFCIGKNAVHTYSTANERSVLVYQSDKESKWTASVGHLINRKASPIRYTWSCRSQASNIMKEVTKGCSKDGIPFLGVFLEKTENNLRLPLVAYSVSNRMAERKVYRGTSSKLCAQHYWLITFG